MLDYLVRQTGGASSAASDASGALHFPHVLEGPVRLDCKTATSEAASIGGTVTANQVTRLELVTSH